MKRAATVLACLVVNVGAAAPTNPLIGTWVLDRYVDTPRGGAPVYAFGENPTGLFVFTADGHASISLMRNPPDPGTASVDPDPDACVPSWYCSYFGTYSYDPKGPSWTTHVTGANIPSYLGTDQKRSFTIKGNRLVIIESYIADGKSILAERSLHKAVK